MKQKEIIASIVTETVSQMTLPTIEGLSAYEVAVNNGFIGTVEEWLLSLHGKDGVDGLHGYTPIKNIDYFDGAKGDTGDRGLQGITGDNGYTPIKGIDYFDGQQGLQGNDGYTPVKGIDYFDGLPGSDATVTKPAVEAVLTGEISTHTHAGGSGGLTQMQIEGLL